MAAGIPTIHVEAPVEKVFRFWADPANLGKLARDLPFFEEVAEDVEVTPEGVDTTYTTAVKVKGVRLASVTDRYVEVEPGVEQQPNGQWR